MWQHMFSMRIMLIAWRRELRCTQQLESHTTQHAVHTSQLEILVATTPHII